jgi:hypothetical protein
MSMENLESTVFVEILKEVGVLCWLQDTLGIDVQEVASRADSDFEGLLSELQKDQEGRG